MTDPLYRLGMSLVMVCSSISQLSSMYMSSWLELKSLLLFWNFLEITMSDPSSWSLFSIYMSNICLKFLLLLKGYLKIKFY